MKKVKVLLIQRGLHSQTHPIGGRSGKTYGTAYRSDIHGGVVGEMTLEDYESAKFDLLNSRIPGQDWVPSFVEEEEEQPSQGVPSARAPTGAKAEGAPSGGEPNADDILDTDSFLKLPMRELQLLVKEHGLTADGSKKLLVAKLRAAMKKEGVIPPP